MDLVLFDLDNTLLSTDSDFEWAQFLIAQGVLDREVHEAKNNVFYEHYKAGTLDIHAFLDFQLQPLTRHDRATLDAWHTEFMKTRILPNIGAAARKLVEKHRTDNAVMAIVTATNSFVTGPIAREFGIAHLIATIPAQDCRSGNFTGLPHGLPSFRDGKITRVEAWLEAQGLWWGSFERSYFYSDSHNDLPLMSLVTNPVAVDPDDTLHEHARQMDWPVISLR
ncbi:MAG TPA: HAD family hydrolase [Rhodocyclaceae bacterium]|nr:HAD family hydrolase [Rhodocyclaceae bacterium]